MSDAALRLEGVDYALGATPALIDVSLHVSHGEFLALIGPNGSGKSTLLKLALGQLEPAAGRVEVPGNEPRLLLLDEPTAPGRADMNFAAVLAEHEFLRVALAAGLLSAVGCGVVGSVVVVKGLTFTAGGIAHAVLGGMGVAHLLGHSPLGGAAVAAVIAALLVGWIGRRSGQREDMLIGAVWAVGMAVGIIAIAHTPGDSTDLMSYLLGNLLMVTPGQLVVMAALDAALLLACVLLWRPLVATVLGG